MKRGSAIRVAVAGAGISGLASAYYLRKFCSERDIGLNLVLFESRAHPGGVFDTVKEAGMTIELGPDSFITYKPWALDLIRDIGLEDSLLGVGDGDGKGVFVYAEGRLHALPDGFFLMAPSRIFPFLRSKLFSARAKLRLLLEPLIPRSSNRDQSIASFVRKRLGNEILEKAAQPLLGGIYMSDPENLSLASTVPQFLEMEKQNKSVLLSLLRNPPGSRGESGARYGLFLTLRDGMSVLTERLLGSARFSDTRFQTPINSLRKSDGRWIVKTECGEDEFDAVILSVPAYAAGSLLLDVAPELAKTLCSIEYISSAVAVCVFEEKEFFGLPDGFGIIIPDTEGMNIVACSLYSKKFPSKCGSAKVVIRCFLGGQKNPEVASWSEQRIKMVLRDELLSIFGADNHPVKTWIRKYPESMPHFAVGHPKTISEISERISRYKGLGLCGAYMGVGISDCVRSGNLASRRIIDDIVCA